MADQKYCPNCGTPNLPVAKFCANCGGAFSAQSSQHISPQEAPYLEDEILNKIRGLLLPVTGKKILVGGVLLVLLIVAVSAMASPSNSGGATSTVTPTPASTVAPTAEATATPTATPLVPTSAASLSPSDLSAVDSYLTSQGYTILQPLAANGTTSGYPTYSGLMSKDGITYATTLEQTDSAAHATSAAGTWVIAAQGMGFSGSYQSDGSWLGTMIDPNTGNAVGASVSISGNTVIAILGE